MGNVVKLKCILDFCHYIAELDPKSNKYSARLILTKESEKILKKAITDLKADQPTIKFTRRIEINDAETKHPENDRVHGLKYINVKTGEGHKPYLANRAGKTIDPDNVRAYFYSGVIVTAFVSVYKYTYSGQNGISFSFNGLQSWEEGEKLFQGGMPEPEFEALEPLDMSDYESADDSGDDDLDY